MCNVLLTMLLVWDSNWRITESTALRHVLVSRQRTASFDSFLSPGVAATLSIMARARPRYPGVHIRGMPLNTAWIPAAISTLPRDRQRERSRERKLSETWSAQHDNQGKNHVAWREREVDFNDVWQEDEEKGFLRNWEKTSSCHHQRVRNMRKDLI